MRSFIGGLVLVALVFPASAQNLRDDPGRRKAFLPTVKGATDCIARSILDNPAAPQQFASFGSVSGVLPAAISYCDQPLRFMIAEHDRLYGYGTGLEFFNGAYRNDLERAVLARIRPALERKKAEIEQAERDRRTAELRAQEQRRLDQERLETERQLERARQEKVKRQRIEEAEKTKDLLKEEFYKCTNVRLLSLVRSGEPAPVLAKAAITLCGREIDGLLDSGVEIFRIQASVATVTKADETIFRERAREVLLEHVTASAVQAKAAYIGNQ